MHVGTHISAQDLLSEIHQAMLDVAETSAHVGRRLREARLSLGQFKQIETTPIGEVALALPRVMPIRFFPTFGR
jgi:hypothetical protein